MAKFRDAVAALAAAMALGPGVVAAEPSAWDSRALKRELEGDIQTRILNPILGRERAFVFVDLEVELTSRRSRNSREGRGISSRFRGKVEPGVDLFKSFGFPNEIDGESKAQGQRAVQAKDDEELVSSEIWKPKRVTITVLHDEALAPESLALVRRSVAEAYPEWRLEPSRVRFRPIPFQRGGSSMPWALPVLVLGVLALGAGWRKGASNGGEGLGVRSSPRPLLAPALVTGCLAAIVWHAEGGAGLKPFLNVEALAVVLIGTLGIVGASHPLPSFARAVAVSLRAEPDSEERWRAAEVLGTGARAAVTAGLLGTGLGLILLLSSVSDVTEIPRRLALAMSSGVFGLFLSEFVLAPMARRCAGAPRGPADEALARHSMAAAGLGAAGLTLFAILYALSASLR